MRTTAVKRTAVTPYVSLLDCFSTHMSGYPVPSSSLDDPSSAPRLAVRVGVTGHRSLRADAVDSVLRSIGAVLDEVAEQAEVIRAGVDSGFSSQPPLLRAISPLAEGADRHFARLALQRGWELQCPLPFERAEYERDFEGDESKAEFRALLAKATAVLECDGDRQDAEEGYQSVAVVLLNQIDVLIAVWNGKAAEGIGGTALVVQAAQRQHVPTLWINSEDGRVIMLAGAAGSLAGRLWKESLRESMNRSIAIGGTTPSVPLGHDLLAQRDRLDDAIHIPRSRASALSWFFQSSFNLLSWPARLNSDAPERRGVTEAIQSPYWKHFERANQAAVWYAGVDCGGTLLNYALGIVAVLCALLGLALRGSEGADGRADAGWLMEWLVAVELMALAAIAWLYAVVRLSHAKLRALDCRLYAEQLRQAMFLWPIGRMAPESRPMAHESFGDPRSTAMAWRFRALVREVGMPDGRLDERTLAVALSLIRESWIGGATGQLNYHRGVAFLSHRVDHRLHVLAWILFGTTLACCCGHLFAHGNHSIEPWLSFACAACPALSAAAHAVTNQFELKRLRERSDCMREALAEALANLPNGRGGGKRLSSRAIAEAVYPASRAMMDEVIGWRILSSKPPTEPA